MIEYDFDNLDRRLIIHKHKVRKLVEETKLLNDELKLLIELQEKIGRDARNTKTNPEPAKDHGKRTGRARGCPNCP